MAAGKINLQKASGGIIAITGVDGASNTNLVLPESGELVTKEYADLKVALESFTGANQSLIGAGYQKFPGGLIIQWGMIGFGVTNVAFPISFPNAFLGISAVSFQGEGVPRYSGFTLSGFITASAGAATASIYIAIGH